MRKPPEPDIAHAPLEAAGLVRSGEADDATARRIALGNCILRSLVGSNLHGLNNPGTDDRDEMGVCVEPPEYVTGLRAFEHFVYRTQPEGTPSGPGDLDLTVYGLRKYVRLALKGSPTVLLLLHVPKNQLLVRTQLGDELQALAPAFVSQRTGRAFLGYLEAQRQALVAERPRTREQSAEHGYDTKYAMHALRIGFQGQELMASGRITLPCPEPQRSELMAVRRGEVPMDELLARLEEVVAGLEGLTHNADLPEAVAQEAIDAFLVDAYARVWAEGIR